MPVRNKLPSRLPSEYEGRREGSGMGQKKCTLPPQYICLLKNLQKSVQYKKTWETYRTPSTCYPRPIRLV